MNQPGSSSGLALALGKREEEERTFGDEALEQSLGKVPGDLWLDRGVRDTPDCIRDRNAVGHPRCRHNLLDLEDTAHRQERDGGKAKDDAYHEAKERNLLRLVLGCQLGRLVVADRVDLRHKVSFLPLLIGLLPNAPER